MGKKGLPNKKWTKEEELHYVKLHLEEYIPIMQIEKEYGIKNSPVSEWCRRYTDDGEEVLEPRNRNPYAALTTSKSLSELDRLRLLVAKQEVEIARLKKVSG